MKSDIEAYDNPVKAVAEPEPVDLCIFCGRRTCPYEHKPYAVDWSKDGKRVKGCDTFSMKHRKPLMFVLRVLMCMSACVAISQPFSVWWMIIGSVVAVTCRQVSAAL